jgi:hypothetical protein
VKGLKADTLLKEGVTMAANQTIEGVSGTEMYKDKVMDSPIKKEANGRLSCMQVCSNLLCSMMIGWAKGRTADQPPWQT